MISFLCVFEFTNSFYDLLKEVSGNIWSMSLSDVTHSLTQCQSISTIRYDKTWDLRLA